MVTRKLFLDDSYRRSCTARVVATPAPNQVLLDQTVLYAESGGQAADHGTIRWPGGEATIVDSQYAPDSLEDIVHTLEGASPPSGVEVEVDLAWSRRYGLMRHHTAVHVMAALIQTRYSAPITGGQLYSDRARLDGEFKDWKPELKDAIERAVNEELQKDRAVRHETISRKQFEQEQTALVRTREVLVDPRIQEIRLTIIEGFDRQADGGTHVRSTKEVGRFVLDKVENKGKGHRRLNLHVE